MSIVISAEELATGPWTGAERRRLVSIIGVVAVLHVLGIVLYLAYQGSPTVAGGLAGFGLLAYVLGMRHAFDADHIAAIDDTTRIMLLRGRRPVGVGFFFAMGHSTVVLLLGLLVALGAGSLSAAQMAGVQEVGGVIATVAAITFLLIVASLNGMVLRNLFELSRRLRRGEDVGTDLEASLAGRGVLSRLLGRRLRGVIRSSWHMYPVGLLMGLGLETASEVTLLAMTALTATGGTLPLLAVLSLPLLFAAGMSAFDTADSLIMTRAYSWSYRSPARRLFYNTATTSVTVVIAVFVASVYLAGVLTHVPGFGWLSPVGAIANNFELLGYTVAGTLIATWIVAGVWWRFSGRAAEAAAASCPNGALTVRPGPMPGRPGHAASGAPVERSCEAPISADDAVNLGGTGSVSAHPIAQRA